MRPAKFNRGHWAVTRERFALTDPRPPPPLRDAVELRDVVSHLMKKIEGARCNRIERLARDWRSVVGEDIAAHTRPGHIDRDQLIVFVDNSVWLYELKRIGATRMLQNVRRYLDADDVKRVSLQIDPDPR